MSGHCHGDSGSHFGGAAGSVGESSPPGCQVLRLAMLDRSQHATSRRLVAAQFVGDQHPGHVLQPCERLAKEPGRRLGVTPGGDQDVQRIPVLVDRPPQIVSLSADLMNTSSRCHLSRGAPPAPTQPLG
jgi:hypothetical protein